MRSLTELKYWYWLKPKEKALMWLVWKLPRKVVMWSYIRVGAHATTGKFSNTIVPEITMMEALKRWDEK